MKSFNHKKLIIIRNILIVLLLLSVAACSQRSTTVSIQGQSDRAVVVDCMGRNVQVVKNPQRIACLCPEAGHAVAMMGKGDKIVAVVDGLKRDVIMTTMYPNIKDASVPRVSGFINIEELIACHPDLVFIKEDTARDQGEIDKLNRSGLTYLVVDYTNMEEQLRAIDVVGRAVSNEEQAAQYRQYYQQCLEKVNAIVETIPKENRVHIYHSVNEATRTDVKDTLSADIFEAAGAVNVSLQTTNLRLYEGKYYASLEQILLWNPDAILCSEPGVAGYIKNNAQWSALSAVKNDKVFQMPNGISRWGHPSSLETPLAILWTAKTIYPGLFMDVDLNSEVKNFYRQFFNLDVSDDHARQILNGTGMREAKN